MIINMEGAYYSNYAFWNAATKANPDTLKQHLALLSKLAESNLCTAGKDISMGGLAGTLLMLCEATGCGALLDLELVPKPFHVSFTKWLTSFPRYGFLLSVPRENVAERKDIFASHALTCTTVGEMTEGSQVRFKLNQEQQVFWDLINSLTGFDGSHPEA